MGRDITISALDGSGPFSAYLAEPASGTGPGVVVIQEIFGVNADVRSKCDAWAAKGYVALAPDLFWRQEPGVQLTDQTDAEWAKAFELYKGFDVDKGVEDLTATIAALRAQPGCSGKIGTVGYCLGGLLAYLLATRSNADANVGYYGVGIDGKLNESHAIAKPLMLHIAQEDKFVDKDAQAAIHAELGKNHHVTLHDYAGQEHAFSRAGGQHYDKASADLANQRTEAFFAGHLR